MPTGIKITDIACLAGIIEGEGSIMYDTEKRNVGYHIWRLTITNTDVFIINKCTRILNLLNVRHNIVTTKIRPGRNKPCHHIEVCSLSHIQAVIEQIIPYMIGEKRGKALLMLMQKPKKRSDGKNTNATKYVEPTEKQTLLFH